MKPGEIELQTTTKSYHPPHLTPAVEIALSPKKQTRISSFKNKQVRTLRQLFFLHRKKAFALHCKVTPIDPEEKCIVNKQQVIVNEQPDKRVEMIRNDGATKLFCYSENDEAPEIKIASQKHGLRSLEVGLKRLVRFL